MRNSEWLLRSLDLSISSTNDANWFWSSRGGTSTSISLSKNILNSAKVDPDPILGYSTNVFSLIKYCKNLELKTSLLGEMHKTRPSL